MIIKYFIILFLLVNEINLNNNTKFYKGDGEKIYE